MCYCFIAYLPLSCYDLFLRSSITFMCISPLHCIYHAPSCILAFWLKLSVLCTTKNKVYPILSYMWLLHQIVTSQSFNSCGCACHWGVPDVWCAEMHTFRQSSSLCRTYWPICVSSLKSITHAKSPYRPQSDGLVERFSRMLIDTLSKFCCERFDDWHQHFTLCFKCLSSNAQWKYWLLTKPSDVGEGDTNASWSHVSSNQGYHCHVKYVDWVRRALQDDYERGCSCRMPKKHYLDVWTKSQQFKEGDLVLHFYPPNLKNKLKAPYLGPFHIMAPLREMTYQIKKSPTSRPLVVHINCLKHYRHSETPPAIQKTSHQGNEKQANSDHILYGDIDSDTHDNGEHGNSSGDHNYTQPQPRRCNRQRKRPSRFDD